MPVTFVVEDGTGKTDATSYIDVSAADQLLTDYGLAWPTGYDSDHKKVALNNGTQFIDQRYYDSWKGLKGTADQALNWPRMDVEDRDGWYLDSDVIPDKLKAAVVEAAVYWATNGSVFPSAGDPGPLKRERIKIDVLEFEEEYLGSNSGGETVAKIDALLAPYIGGVGGGCNVEVERG